MDSPTLFDTLQKEFCPPLDSSLLAALCADIQFDDQNKTQTPSEEQIENLRNILRQLAGTADEESQLSDDFSDMHFSSSSTTTTTPELFNGGTATSSSQSTSYDQPFDSPLGFLQAALPHIPTSRLSAALDDEGVDVDDLDMEKLVNDILSKEFIRDLEERGLDEPESTAPAAPWTTARPKASKRKSTVTKVLTLGDVRHRALTPRHNTSNDGPPAPDPWTTISSISSHLAGLLPSQSPSFFQSYFHSPKYTTPYDALCAALLSISVPQEEVQNEALFGLLDILLASYPSVDASSLIYDARLALAATHGRGDDALDLVRVLYDLNTDSLTGLELGPYHLPPPAPLTRASSQASVPSSPTITSAKLPSGPPPTILPTSHKHSKTTTQASSPRRNKPSPYQWQAVPQRSKPPNMRNHALAASIPAYSLHLGHSGARGAGNALGKGGKGDVGELAYRRRVAENMRRRDEMVREASKMWRMGSGKNRGGEVALYFAERARQFQEIAQKESLNAARAMVLAKRETSHDQDTVDLHGVTVTEAITIVKEILAKRPSTSSSNPLRIITGRGSHSANHVGVLKPAVKSALTQDGWHVSSWDAGLVVRGHR